MSVMLAEENKLRLWGCMCDVNVMIDMCISCLGYVDYLGCHDSFLEIVCLRHSKHEQQ